MSEQEFNIVTADVGQMRTWAKNNIDVNIPAKTDRATAVEMIVNACNALQIPVPTGSIITRQEKQMGKTDNTVLIKIPKTKDPGGKEPVFVGFQGTGYLIPRDVECRISQGVAQVLNNAITDHVSQDIDPKTGDMGEMRHDESPTYAFQILEGRIDRPEEVQARQREAMKAEADTAAA